MAADARTPSPIGLGNSVFKTAAATQDDEQHHLKPPHTPSNTAIMVFIFGVNFPEQQLVSRSLQSFYGIGPNVSKTLMARYHIHNTARIGALREKQITDLATELSNMTLENDLRRQLVDNIKRLRDMGTYRGRRHAMGLPVRGQNTQSQVMTARKLNKVERRG